jgi:ribosomal protein S18 acetylase RimI-like enzyme
LFVSSKLQGGSDKTGAGAGAARQASPALGPGTRGAAPRQFGERAQAVARPAWHTLAAVQCSIPLRELSRAAFVAELDALTGVYEAAMRPDPAQLPGRRSIMQRHATYQGFRALVVTADAAGQPGPPGRIVGFTYGFRGADGQWWHDVVEAALTARAGRALAAAWLADSLEVAEVHVHPDFHRRGIGRRLVLGLAEGRGERTAVLSTQDADSPARRLYRWLGFADLLTGYRFPGAPVPYAVMGAALPLRPAGEARSSSRSSR